MVRQVVRRYSLDEAVDLIFKRVIERVRQSFTEASGATVFLGISGIDCSGKTTLAKALLERANSEGLIAKLVMVDDFMIPEADRAISQPPHIQWFESTFDHERFAEKIKSSSRVDGVQLVIAEGVFLFRRELAPLWELKAWMEMSTERSLECGIERDAEFFGSSEQARVEYLRRFVPAHEHHLARDKPSAHADFVFHVD